MAERLQVREVGENEGRRLVRIVRRDGGPVVTWRRGQMVLLARTEYLCAIAGGEVVPEPGEPEVIFCVDESRD